MGSKSAAQHLNGGQREAAKIDPRLSARGQEQGSGRLNLVTHEDGLATAASAVARDRVRTVDQVMDDFLHEHTALAVHTVAGYRSVSRSVILNPEYGLAGADVTALTSPSLTAWRRAIPRDRVSKANRRLAFAVLRSALSWEVEVGRLDRNPALGLTTRRTKSSIAEGVADPVRLPMWEEMHRTAMAIPERPTRLMYLLLAFCGFRASELFAVHPADVLPATSEIEVVRVFVKPKGQPWKMEPPKTGLSRLTHVPAGLMTHVGVTAADWSPPGGNRYPVLFRPPTANRHGPGLWTNELWRTLVIGPANTSVGLDFRTKDLRAFAASMIVDVGATQTEAQRHLGHLTSETTQRFYIRAQHARAHDPARSALRFDTSLNLEQRLDALWDVFVDRFGDPLDDATFPVAGVERRAEDL